MVLDSTISLPMVGSVTLKLTIKYLTTTKDDDAVLLGCEFSLTDDKVITAFAEYLLHFASEVTVESLKKEGFHVDKISKTLDFTYVKNAEDFVNVLKLRAKCFSSCKNKEISYTDMSDAYDLNAHILIVKHKGRIVGSTRLNLANSYDQHENSKYVCYPSNLPNPQEVTEASRLCVDGEYRGADVAYELINHIFLVSILARKNYLIVSAKNKELEFYEQIGFKKLNTSFIHPVTPVKHELLILNILDIINGRGISPQIWGRYFKKLADHLKLRDDSSNRPTKIAKT
ncbi:MAG: GNAT family N-acetyltransferase [Oligoflexia bacterium]|nr:GNAT family N-acetyltransferase [Oligoflexia bacterium]